jgi:tRNA threonylcarbamoyladenosine modification (KEOPS) complex  Pcc1 subunit
MKIIFDDKSFIECQKSPTDKIILTIGAKDSSDPLKKIVNSVEISTEEWSRLISEISPDVKS